MKKFLGTRSASLFLILILCFFYIFICSCGKKVVHEVSYTIYGYVTDAEGGKPIVNAEMLEGNSIIDSTDTSGYYHRTSFGGNERLKITASAEGYLQMQKEVYVPKNSQVRVDFALTKE